jgi:hypothetical protein
LARAELSILYFLLYENLNIFSKTYNFHLKLPWPHYYCIDNKSLIMSKFHPSMYIYIYKFWILEMAKPNFTVKIFDGRVLVNVN